MGLIRLYNNISIGKKLGFGFAFVLFLSTLIAGLGGYYLIKITQQSEMISASVEMNNELIQAKDARSTYRQTYDPKYIELNKVHIANIGSVINRSASLKWHKRDRKYLDNILQLVQEQHRLRTGLIAAVAKKDAIRASWNLSESDELLQKIENSVKSGSQQGLVELMRLRGEITLVRYNVRGMIIEPNSENGTKVINAINRAEETAKLLKHIAPMSVISNIDDLVSVLEEYRKNVDGYPEAVEMERTIYASMSKVADNLNVNSNSLFQAKLADANDSVSIANIGMLITAVLALIVGTLIAFAITRHITVPLRTTLNVTQKIAEGDLSTEVSSQRRDEFGELLNAVALMNGNLRKMIGDIYGGVTQISSAAENIAMGNINLSSRTEQQAAALEQTAASMEELTATVKQNAENAHHASKLASTASVTAKEGGEIVASVVTTMNDIAHSSKKVTEIISVINSIAFQTNILALNAAVEAARAGEQGRGFAVVASEVRSLAQRSAQAAKEIEGLISESVNRIDNGTNLVNKAGDTMEDIVKSIGNVTGIMGEIASASDEQSKGIDQISQAVSEMDNVTQQNSSLVQESAAAAAALEEQAILLNSTVSQFRLTSQPEAV